MLRCLPTSGFTTCSTCASATRLLPRCRHLSSQTRSYHHLGGSPTGSFALSPARLPTSRYSRQAFFRKLHNPRASKPWRNRAASATGAVLISSSNDVQTTSAAAADRNKDGVLDGEESGAAVMLAMGPLTTPGVLGMRSPHVSVDAAAAMWRGSGEGEASLPSSSAFPASIPAGERDASVAVALPSGRLYGEHVGRGDATLPIPTTTSNTSGATSPAMTPTPRTTIAMGKTLDWTVDAVESYPEGAVPLSLQRDRHRAAATTSTATPTTAVSKRELAESIRLPRNLNALFHKIAGWSDELEELEDDEGGALQHIPEEEQPQLAAQKMKQLTNRVKYGVLMEDYDKDRFALEHQLTVAGNKFEKAFLNWEGVNVLDQDMTTDAMPFVSSQKAAIVMSAPSAARVPVVNVDCCPGCGVLLQNRDEHAMGYVAPGEVERFVMERDRRVECRQEYATRMAELQRHWEKHGRQVGEEWLDFMTQEEFDATYRDRRAPFVCHRCHALEHLGVNGRRQVFSAPDFTESLKALREKRCVVVLVIDITDFPGTMIHDLCGLISMNNPVIIAANKMDCVRNRSFQYAHKDRAVSKTLVSERYVKRWVKEIAMSFGLPKHLIQDVILCSAKRGWNVDQLIAAVENHANLNLRRPHAPLPTYFVGVANVGKSSLLNAVAHHLYVPQPPHPASKKVYYTRVNEKTGEEALLWRWYTPPNVNRAEMVDIPSRHDKKASKLLTVSSLPGTTVSVNAVKVSLVGGSSTDSSSSGTGKAPTRYDGDFLYDTPGVLPHWHKSSSLTLLEMRRLLIRKFRRPQCFILKPGHTLHFGGLAAIDIVKGCEEGLLFMVYASQKVMNGIVETPQSDLFYEEQLGRRIGPPSSYEHVAGGGEDRNAASAASSPLSVSRTYLFECYPRHRRRPVADVYVCGLGWVSFCVREACDVLLRVRTLPGVVHGVRQPLRYNDLRAYRHWPKLPKRVTSRGLEEKDPQEQAEGSIATVVKLVSSANQRNHSPERSGTVPSDTNTNNDAAVHTNTAKQEDETNLPSSIRGANVQVLKRTPHPVYQSASSSPLSDLVSDLHL